MQKRPSGYPLRYDPYDLPDAFAASYVHRWRQGDAQIAYLHQHNVLEIGYCHSGSGLFVVEGKVLPYHAGDGCVISQSEAHLARSLPGTSSAWSFCWLDPGRLVSAVSDEPRLLSTAELAGPQFPCVLRGGEQPECVETIRQIMEELEGQRPGYRTRVRGLVWSLQALLHRLPGQQAGAVSAAGAMARIARALQYLAEHYMEPLSIRELARMCELSPTHFRRVFREAVGQSPQQHLTQLRVGMAAALLRGGERAITEIALDVGYPTLSSFNRHFRSLLNTTPRSYRRSGWGR